MVSGEKLYKNGACLSSMKKMTYKLFLSITMTDKTRHSIYHQSLLMRISNKYPIKCCHWKTSFQHLRLNVQLIKNKLFYRIYACQYFLLKYWLMRRREEDMSDLQIKKLPQLFVLYKCKWKLMIWTNVTLVGFQDWVFTFWGGLVSVK